MENKNVEQAQLLTPKEVAKLLQISEATLARMRSYGSKGPSWIKMKGSVRYRLQDILDWQESQLTQNQ